MKVINIQDIDIPEDCATYDELAQFADKIAELAVNYLEVAEPKRGRWIKVYGDHIHIGLRPWATACSECGLVSRETNFCPNCGARMDKE